MIEHSLDQVAFEEAILEPSVEDPGRRVRRPRCFGELDWISSISD